jgi:hypothetical protein
LSEFRVIYHERSCPDCGSDDITQHDVEMIDGTDETALICQACGAAWPVACVAEQLEAVRTDLAARPHLVLRIDGCPPAAEAARRLYWCPACDGYLSGTELASVPVLHYTPGSDRVITEADLHPPGARS